MDIERDIITLLKKVLTQEFRLKAGGDTTLVRLDVPKEKCFGDFSTNLAFILAQKVKARPLDLAAQLQQALQAQLKDAGLAGRIERIEVKGAGFVNFFLSQDCLQQVLLEIHELGSNFGKISLGGLERVHIEFVSANPTGPLNVAHGRQAAFGDTLANILDFAGYRVTREYYLNDEGVQIDLLGESLRAKYLLALGLDCPFPSSGYQGRYIEELAGELAARYGRRLAKNSQKSLSFFSQFAYRRILKEIKGDLASFAVEFNSWFSQRSLKRSGKIERALESLKAKGAIYQKEGASWLATTKFGDDKDRVVIKSDGKVTYITPDIAYHQTKFKRKFARLINIWGPDHHGYIPRMRAAISILGHDPTCVSFLIVQQVSLVKADKIIPMSTRAGQYISLSEIIQAIGKDAARFFFLMRRRDAHLQFDLELARKQSLENPVYYIQYAYARIQNILKFAREGKGLKSRPGKSVNLALLDKPEEIKLIQILAQLPKVVESCALNLEPHRLSTYLQDIARAFHHYYELHRVVTDDPALTNSRIMLLEAVKIVLNQALGLLRVSRPEKM